MKKNCREDFTVLEVFETRDGEGNVIPALVPEHVRIEFYVKSLFKAIICERKGDRYFNCRLASEGYALECAIPQFVKGGLGTGLLRHRVTIVFDNAVFPASEQYVPVPELVTLEDGSHIELVDGPGDPESDTNPVGTRPIVLVPSEHPLREAVLYVEQDLTEAQKAQARENIGAGTSDFSGEYEDLNHKPDLSENQRSHISASGSSEVTNPKEGDIEVFPMTVSADNLQDIPSSFGTANSLLAQAKHTSVQPQTGYDWSTVILRNANTSAVVCKFRGYDVLDANDQIIGTLPDVDRGYAFEIPGIQVGLPYNLTEEGEGPQSPSTREYLLRLFAGKNCEYKEYVNGTWVDRKPVPSNVVQYTAQSLTDAQKAQARTNIGAGTYSKPLNGIPKSDLASAVQNTLNAAYIPPESGIPKNDLNVELQEVIDNAVLYSSQNLTDEEKAQARTNIEAYYKPETGIPESDLNLNLRNDLSRVRDSMLAMRLPLKNTLPSYDFSNYSASNAAMTLFGKIDTSLLSQLFWGYYGEIWYGSEFNDRKTMYVLSASPTQVLMFSGGRYYDVTRNNDLYSLTITRLDPTKAYVKPATGIPSSDMANAVQTSLEKADTAYQKPQNGIPATDLNANVVSGLVKRVTSSKSQIPADFTTNDLNDLFTQFGITADDFLSISLGSATEIKFYDRNTLSTEYTYEICIVGDSIIFSYGTELYILTVQTSPSVQISFAKHNVELSSNKRSSWQTAPDNNHYPSEKLVKDSLDAKQAVIDAQNKLDYSLLDNTPVFPTVPTISTNVQTDKASDTKTSSPKSVYDEVHPAVASSEPAGGMLPNVLYKLGTLTGTVTISFASPSDNTIENEYKFTFDTSSTAPSITFPNSITSWNGNCLDRSTPAAPVISASKHYEVSVEDGYAYIVES